MKNGVECQFEVNLASGPLLPLQVVDLLFFLLDYYLNVESERKSH